MNSKATSGMTLRHSFSGVYAFRMQGWLRATDDGDGSFYSSGRPEQQKPVVVAGFQLPPDTPPTDPTRLPAQKVNAGYFPYVLLGELTYSDDHTIQGWIRIGIGGNSSGKSSEVTGTYELLGNSGTFQITDPVNQETATYAFILTDADKEIEFMDLGSQPGSTGGHGLTAIGVQRRSGD